MRTILILSIILASLIGGCVSSSYMVSSSYIGNTPNSGEVVCKVYHDCLERARWFCAPTTYDIYSHIVTETLCYWSVTRDWICEEELRHYVRFKCEQF